MFGQWHVAIRAIIANSGGRRKWILSHPKEVPD